MLVFDALPFVAGVGIGVLIFGTDAIKDAALPLIVYICVGTFVATMVVDSLIEPFSERFFSENKVASEALAFVIGVWVISLRYGFVFSEPLPALTAAFISAAGMFAFIPLIKRFKPAAQ